MRRRVLRFTVPVFALVGLATGVGRSQRAPSANDSKDPRTLAVNVVRLINTAELELRARQGRYVPLGELVRSGDLAKTAKRFPVVDLSRLNLESEEGLLPGWDLRIVVSADGTRYKLSLVNKSDKCLFGFFSDQVGIIYNGKVIDCPVD